MIGMVGSQPHITTIVKSETLSRGGFVGYSDPDLQERSKRHSDIRFVIDRVMGAVAQRRLVFRLLKHLCACLGIGYRAKPYAPYW
jgi:hypothetical protein